MFAIAAFVGVPIGYVAESYYYTLQKIGKMTTETKRAITSYNLCALGMVAMIYYMVNVDGIENLSTIELYVFIAANAIAFSVFLANGAQFGAYIRAQRRYLNNEEVPAHLIKTEEDEEREAKIREAKRQEDYRMMEEEVGLVAEEEAKYKNDEIDHEAILEEILKSRK